MGGSLGIIYPCGEVQVFERIARLVVAMIVGNTSLSTPPKISPIIITKMLNRFKISQHTIQPLLPSCCLQLQ